MCGIVGAVLTDAGDTYKYIISGLYSLEYRGYDSAGIAYVSSNGIQIHKAVGNISKLEAVVSDLNLRSKAMIGHTRWATHGKPSIKNAHPVLSGRFCVVHNGIIENFDILKAELEAKGYSFVSDTDTEVISMLIESLYDGSDFLGAVHSSLKRLEGAFAIAALCSDHEDEMIIAKRYIPMVVSVVDGKGTYVASDPIALTSVSKEVMYIEDDTIGVITDSGLTLYDSSLNELEYAPSRINDDLQTSSIKDGFEHFMLKEIYEQAAKLLANIASYLSNRSLPLNDLNFKAYRTIYIVGCGTSYNAACVAKYWLEEYAGVAVIVDFASEFRYRKQAVDPESSLILFLSQSGETADTLSALKRYKKEGVTSIGIVNVKDSSIYREADHTILLEVGAEIGVASTKTFTSHLMHIAVFIINYADKVGTIKKEQKNDFMLQLSLLPDAMTKFLNLKNNILEIARALSESSSILFIARGAMFPIAVEGALKMKELSYIPSEGIPAGELKHGHIALLDSNQYVVALAYSGSDVFEKTISNVMEVIARGARVILVVDEEGIERTKHLAVEGVIVVPFVGNFCAPSLFTIPLQLCAYHVARLLGNNVDQPRNLAKCVTVE